MNDKIRGLINEVRDHEDRDLCCPFREHADTMERLLAVYEAAVKCVHEDDSHYNVTDSMSDAIAAVEKGDANPTTGRRIDVRKTT